MQFLLQLVGNGLFVGAAYGLIGMSLALIYKGTGILNFAQGEIMMLTAYVAYAVSASADLSIGPLILVIVPVAMLAGVAIDRLFIRPMAGAPMFSVVMATMGLAVIIRGVVILVWGPSPQQFDAGLAGGFIVAGPLTMQPAQLALVVALAAGAALVWAMLRYSRIGVAMRAVASDERSALLMGIDVPRVQATAWAVGSALSAVAGILIAAFVALNSDLWFWGFRAFPAVILGGIDSPLGAALGGVAIGIIENLAQGYIGQGLREIAGFIVIILVLMVRPNGLFGGTSAERV